VEYESLLFFEDWRVTCQESTMSANVMLTLAFLGFTTFVEKLLEMQLWQFAKSAFHVGRSLRASSNHKRFSFRALVVHNFVIDT
jgi:hypothetical protein